MLKIQSKNVISVQDWDDLVTQTYGKPYSFQQQNDCQDRGMFDITIPSRGDDYPNDSVPEVINGEKMGVSFQAWLARDPNEWNGNEEDKNFLSLFWDRNFYPDVQTLANDMHTKGLIPAGDYVIEIDW